MAAAEELTHPQKVAAPAVVTYVVEENSDDAWHTVADWPQGTDIDFALTGTLPEDLASRDSLPYWLVVEPAAGLSFVEGSCAVSVVHEDGSTSDVTQALDVAGSDDEVVAGSANIQAAIPSLRHTDRLRLTYAMRLNQAATRGLANGNDSYAHLEYGGKGYVTTGAASRVVTLRPLPIHRALSSLLPIHAAASATATARDASLARSVLLKTSVYTYDLEAQKVDEGTGEPLAGARFALRDADGRWYHAAEGAESDPKDDAWVDDVAQATTRTTGEDGLAAFGQVDSERYELVEVEAPEGYAAVDPVDVSITTDVVDGSANTTTLGAISRCGEILSADADGGVVRVRIADPASDAGTSSGKASRASKLPLSRTGDATSLRPAAALATLSVLLVACGVVIRFRHASREGGGRG